MKTKEELDALKEEIAALKGKLAELTDEELMLVTGGVNPYSDMFDTEGSPKQYEYNVYDSNPDRNFDPGQAFK